MEFYPELRLVHIAAVLLSGALFAARGIGVQCRARWAMAPHVRYLSYTIDTVLLASALSLLAILPPAVFANHWLTVKVVILVIYIGLGTFALKRGRTRRQKLAFLGAALLAYTTMVVIARTHNPAGPLLWLHG